MFSLPIPEFDASNKLHRKLAELAERAERVAADVEIPDGTNFIRARQLVRRELIASGVLVDIDTTVAALLNSAS